MFKLGTLITNLSLSLSITFGRIFDRGRERKADDPFLRLGEIGNISRGGWQLLKPKLRIRDKVKVRHEEGRIGIEHLKAKRKGRGLDEERRTPPYKEEVQLTCCL